MEIFKKINSHSSNRKTSPASTGTAGIRIPESESAGIQSTRPINFHPQQINRVRTIQNELKAVQFIDIIVLLALIKIQYISHAAATTALYTYP